MTIPEIIQQFNQGIRQTHWLEMVAVVFGIASVLYSRKGNILVFPTGIISTILYTWFCFKWWDLYAEGSLNFYYTIMSVYGWWLWSRPQKISGNKQRSITASSRKEWGLAILFFGICYLVLYVVLISYTNSTLPIADAFASASAYTGMWLMARKKVENWIWWIITNLLSIPLYFVKGAVFTSFQYLIILFLAIWGYKEWRKKLKTQHD